MRDLWPGWPVVWRAVVSCVFFVAGIVAAYLTFVAFLLLDGR